MAKIKDILSNLKNVELQVWLRLALAIGTIYVLVSPLFGRPAEFTIDELEAYIARIGSALSVVWCFWKNNNFTRKAMLAQKVIRGEATICEDKEVP